jgi:hypothetical protein
MAYNEPDFVPVWVRHYAGQFGPAHCHIVDHGSDDGSTEGLGRINVLRIPRSPQDDPRRAAFVSEYCAALLQWYDWVVYSDIDELLVADPRYHAGLAGLCAAATEPVLTAVGLDVQHLPQEEPGIDPSRLISLQRRWAMMTTSMCKPLLISKPVVWTPGFHTCDAPVVFAPLFLFHLRHYDLEQGLRRMAKTRAMAWQYAYAGSHQKLSDQQVRDGRVHVTTHPRKPHFEIDINQPPLNYLLPQITAQQEQRIADKQTYKINIDMVVRQLWRIPERFVGTF